MPGAQPSEVGHTDDVARKGRARDRARGRGTDTVRIDHAVIEPSDLDWLVPVRRLTLWAVDVPEGLLASLPHLEWLDLRGGSRTSADVVADCDRVRYLQLNQVAGLCDLSAVGDLATLELLSLYGLPRVTTMPDLSGLTSLARLELGSMKGLDGIAPALDAPALRELLLVRAVSLAADDPRRIRDATGLTAFSWFAEDVPNRVWQPVVQLVGKPDVETLDAAAWFEARDARRR